MTCLNGVLVCDKVKTRKVQKTMKIKESEEEIDSLTKSCDFNLISICIQMSLRYFSCVYFFNFCLMIRIMSFYKIWHYANHCKLLLVIINQETNCCHAVFLSVQSNISFLEIYLLFKMLFLPYVLQMYNLLCSVLYLILPYCVEQSP